MEGADFPEVSAFASVGGARAFLADACLGSVPPQTQRQPVPVFSGRLNVKIVPISFENLLPLQLSTARREMQNWKLSIVSQL